MSQEILTQVPPTKLPSWRFWLPLLLQAGIIFAAPAQPIYTYITGKTVVIQTVPVDPYDFLRGYSQTLRYNISQVESLKKLPGWQELPKNLPSGTPIYVILAAPAHSSATPPPAWKPVRVSANAPASLAANQIAVQGKYTGADVVYGLETYYMPEAQRDEINQDISQARSGRQPQPIVVEIKVDNRGQAVPISFWVSDGTGKDKAPRNYRF